MNNRIKLYIIIVSLFFISAIKPYYGGIIKIRLNEPNDFLVSTSSYSDIVFYSLIYENFFYLLKNGEKYSNIFTKYQYVNTGYKLSLELKPNLRFSNGKDIRIDDVINSLNSFVEMKSAEAKRLGKVIKSIYKKDKKIIIALNFDYPEIIDLLSVPQLVLISQTQGVFSGPFHPVKWVKNENMQLKANKYYAGGLPYFNSIKIEFKNYYYPDVFLSKPNIDTKGSHREYNSGVYQNYYISFPKGKIGKNTRIAFYSVLKDFFISLGYDELNVLTSDKESPLNVKIKRFSTRKIRTILRYSNIKLYVISTLKNLDSKISVFFKKYKINIDNIFIKYNNVSALIDDTDVKYLITEKVFHKGTSLSNKISSIVKEMSFARFNESYFGLMEQLDEIVNLKDNELLMDHLAGIIQKIITDGYLLPISQKKYSLYLKKNIKNITIDYYGRPLIHKWQYELSLNVQKEKSNGT